jgi:signal transduction histidine kinase/ActR/RegA family two-component response regulator
MQIHNQHLTRGRFMALGFRVASHIAIALIAISIPEVGPNRFWLAGIIVALGSPVAILLNLYVSEKSRNWVEALFDLFLVVTLVHLIPHLWVAALCLGLMVAMAPSISLHPSSHWIYMGFGTLLLSGMTFALVIHNVEGWHLVIAAISVTYPSMLFYTHSQMRRANELAGGEQLMRGMTEMAGSVAHDFNNMLAGISGHTELATRKLPAEHPAREDLLQVIDGAERASLLCNQLLSFAGRNLGRKERVNILVELENIAGLIGPALPDGVNIEIAEPAETLYVEAEISQLHQVLMNILLNAGEAMIDSRGPISVSLTRTNINETSQVSMIVADRGHGIADSVINKVFDTFYTTKKNGRGLGLAATKRIMQDLNGDISVGSRTGGGTQVHLTWPEAVEQNVKELNEPTDLTPALEVHTDSNQRKLILVVDDDKRVRTVAQRLLNHLAYDVLLASDADEASSTFRRENKRIDAILLDLKMPGRDGWSVLNDVRKINAKTPVVICSGFNPSAAQPDIKRDDPNLSYLKKPYRAEDLAAALTTVGAG